MNDSIKRQLSRFEKKLIKVRRDLHKIPEPGFEEIKTSAYLKRELKKAGIPFKPVATTGIVAEIKGRGSGPTVLLRGDIDGVAVAEERADVSFKTVHPGYMHACGHDAHAAMLLTTGLLFNHLSSEFCGRLLLVFQPAEEGRGGGEVVVNSGIIDFKKVDVAAALHVWGALQSGKIGWNSGPTFANSDRFEIVIKGKGGHGSAPSQTLDPITVAAQTITAINSIVSRKVSIHEKAVVSICAINGGQVFNVIPDTVEIKGTVRTFNSKLQNRIARQLKDICIGTARASGLKADFAYDKSYPVLKNDPQVTAIGRQIADKVFGTRNVQELSPTMGGEDFAYFLQKVPGFMFRLGASPTKKPVPHHNGDFMIDESVMIKGVEFLSRFAAAYLKRETCG